MRPSELLTRARDIYSTGPRSDLWMAVIAAEKGQDTVAYAAALAFLEHELGCDPTTWEGKDSHGLDAINRAIETALTVEAGAR
jgi:hypothetical protein